jgi:oligopeptide transport system permease protein
LRKTLIFLLAGLGTIIGIFFLSNFNQAFINQSPDLLKVYYLSVTNLDKIQEKVPEITIQNAKEGIVAVPYGQTVKYSNLIRSVPGVAKVGFIAIKPTLSMKKYTFVLKQQFTSYIHGDFGNVRNNAINKVIPFSDQLKIMIPRTLSYLLPALLLAILLGLITSLVASMKKAWGKMLDTIHLFMIGLPDFIVIVIIQFIAIYASKFTDKRLVLIVQLGNEVPFLIPFLSIAVVPGVLIYGTMRIAIERELKQAYVTTAYSKGLNIYRVLLRHVLRNVLEDLLTVLPKATTVALASMVVAEVICNIIGLGGFVIHPFYEDVSAMPLTCMLLAVFAMGFHGLYALLRKLLVVHTKEVG